MLRLMWLNGGLRGGNEFFSKMIFFMTNCPKHFGISAFESPWFILCIFAHYEHLRALHEHLQHIKNIALTKKCGFGPKSFGVNPSVDAREMLVNARKLQKWKIWIKGFQTHQFRSVFDNSMIIYTTLKLGWFSKKWSFSVIITENVGKWWFKWWKTHIFKRT